MDYFLNKAQEAKNQKKQYQKQYNVIGTVRVIFTLVLISLIIYFANTRDLFLLVASCVVFIAGFVFLVVKHNRIKFRMNHWGFIQEINKEEINRKEYHVSAFSSGEEYLSEDHDFALDLDLFGQHSLFQFLNRTATEQGKEMLAHWLLNPSSNINEIKQRQSSIDELKNTPDWRQEFEALGRHFKKPGKALHEMFQWLEGKEEKNFRLPSWLLYLITLSSIALMVSFFLFEIPGFIVAIPLIMSGYLTKKVFRELGALTEFTESASQVFKTYGKLLELLEQTEFRNDYLQGLKRALHNDNLSAKKEIKELQLIVDRIQIRANFLFAIINILFLYDLHTLIKIDRWKRKNQHNINHWMQALAEIDSLQSIAGFSFLNPDYCVPELSEKPFVYEAEQMGHPLISNKKRVPNDFSLNGKGQILLITGSNMSGKSTFLRTVGLNAVLTYLGAPVCAKKFTLSIFNVYTSMRTTDNLEESVSSFYAELKRLKKLIQRTETNEIPVLFMLDEILKGTNSADRHKGAESLILQLMQTNATGLVSTHDVELGRLESKHQGIKNYSFNSPLVNGELNFNYTLTKGVCESFNASILMEKMGIKIKN